MNERETQEPLGSREPRRPAASGAARPRRFFRDPWFRFAALFGVLALTCELLYYAVLVDSGPLQVYLRALASTAGAILGLLRSDVDVSGTMLSTRGFSVQVAHGCDAIQICALMGCAVLSFPASLRAKVVGLALGILWLQFLNQVRIVSLVLIGTHKYQYFESAHLQVWPTALILITVATWVVWVRAATSDVVAGPGPQA